MDRRKFVLGLGALAGGGAALGTGAFSAVEANRNVTVNVAGDASAYLSIEPHSGPNGAYAETTGNDALAVDVTGDNENLGSGIAGGEGINANAITTMENVFTIENQGTTDVEVDVDPLVFIETSGGFPPDSAIGLLTVPAVVPRTLGPGESESYSQLTASLELDGEPDVELDDQIRVTAEEI